MEHNKEELAKLSIADLDAMYKFLVGINTGIGGYKIHLQRDAEFVLELLRSKVFDTLDALRTATNADQESKN